LLSSNKSGSRSTAAAAATKLADNPLLLPPILSAADWARLSRPFVSSSSSREDVSWPSSVPAHSPGIASGMKGSAVVVLMKLGLWVVVIDSRVVVIVCWLLFSVVVAVVSSSVVVVGALVWPGRRGLRVVVVVARLKR